MNDLILNEFGIGEVLCPEKLFVPGGLEYVINLIKDIAEAEADGLDPNTDKGRKAFGTLCRKISSSKVFISSAAKAYVADLKAKVKPVDGERIRWEKAMDELRDAIDAPRRAWQQEEDAKIAEADAVMRELNTAVVILAGTTSADLSKRIDRIEKIDTAALPEDYIDHAESLRNTTLTTLYCEHAEMEKREKEAEELAKLRKEAAERAEADRKAKEEEYQRQREEEIKVRAIEAAKFEAEEKAERERKKAEQREAQLKDEKEAAERRAKEAEEKAARNIKEALRKEKEEADRKASDAQHRADVHREAAFALIGLNEIIDQVLAEAIIDRIASGNVPHVKIEY